MCRCPLILLFAASWLSACSPVPKFDVSELQPGGETTASVESSGNYIVPAANLSKRMQKEFWLGRAAFKQPWVIAPSSTTARDGVGPLFNARSCMSCHRGGGRGYAPEDAIMTPSVLFRVAKKDGQEVQKESVYGGQLQPMAIPAQSADRKLQAEAKVAVHFEPIHGQFDDGEKYTLKRPIFTFSNWSHGNIEPGYGLSPRYAPVVYGMGLLEAIPEEALVALEDPEDQNQDGISGRLNRVVEIETGEIRIGRFGLKAKHPTLAQQVGGAFQGDLGLTNRFFQEEPCSKQQLFCQEVAQSTDGTNLSHQYEVQEQSFDATVYFNQLMAVPEARDLMSPQTIQGRTLFYKIGCQHCHQPSYTTAQTYPIPELANQKIWPFTDLALHDMGPDLADGTTEFLANGQEWRTPPLWGIGTQQKQFPSAGFLHDGRAKTIMEAILWHGGEAEQQRNQVRALSKKERVALIHYLESI
ncbi:di-heme oxidoreductase family protein [Algicola sagamiensis]|uniref:di-heme oxidoreductase family protein n=1 Tax=Algicola sagamiensis TaxID=163869 RepID=UPI00035DAE2B|nr:di-heme oxidoredictase family protein [Algicola sagamiensis]